MKIRAARADDLPLIMKIYAHARRFMVENGNPNQWASRLWPPEELIASDISSGHCYVCTDAEDVPHGVFYYNYGLRVEPSYNNIADGEWLGGDEYGVVHRIAADGSQRGIGALCLSWAFDKSGQLRIDTHPDNRPMQGLLGKLGFKKCGIIHIREDNAPRYAYEKLKR